MSNVEELKKVIKDIEQALSNHPRCDKYDSDDVISCGWKSAVSDVQNVLDNWRKA